MVLLLQCSPHSPFADIPHTNHASTVPGAGYNNNAVVIPRPAASRRPTNSPRQYNGSDTSNPASPTFLGKEPFGPSGFMLARNWQSAHWFLFVANAPVLTPKPEHIRADIEPAWPRDDPVIDKCPAEETFVDKRLGNRAADIFDMSLEVKLGNQAVFVGEGDLEIAVDSHRFKSWSHANPSILVSVLLIYSYVRPVRNARTTAMVFGRRETIHFDRPEEMASPMPKPQ